MAVKQKYSAGLVVIYDKKILLVHPTKEQSFEKTYSFPKGKIELKYGETPQHAAVRETFEETGILFDIKKLKKSKSGTFSFLFQEIELNKNYTYFLYKVSKKEFKTLLNSKLEIPKENLPLKEIDDAAFFTLEDAKVKLAERFSPILKLF